MDDRLAVMTAPSRVSLLKGDSVTISIALVSGRAHWRYLQFPGHDKRRLRSAASGNAGRRPKTVANSSTHSDKSGDLDIGRKPSVVARPDHPRPALRIDPETVKIPLTKTPKPLYFNELINCPNSDASEHPATLQRNILRGVMVARGGLEPPTPRL